MAIGIGDRIRDLRKAKDSTQEALADFLGVTCQAVSRWENGIGYPDIGYLPAIARFLGTTTDWLLGVDHQRDEEGIQGCLDEFARLKNEGDEHRCIAFIRGARAKYPHDWRILEKYVWQLAYAPGCIGFKDHSSELMGLCERILGECTDDQIRYTAIPVLGGVHEALGDHAKALEYARRLPNNYHTTACEELEQFHRNNGPYKEYIKCLHGNIYSLVFMLHVKIRNMALETTDPDERIRLHLKSMDLFRLVFDGTDYHFANFDLADACFWIGNRYLEKGDTDSARRYLEASVGHCIAYDTMPERLSFASPLLNALEYGRTDTYKDFKSKCALELPHYEGGLYDSVRDTEWFVALTERLRETAERVGNP